MDISFSTKYATEGAPMLIGGVENAQFWNGPKDDGSGIIVSYWGQGLETLPKEFAQTKKKGGERRKKFTHIKAAVEFQNQLLEQLTKLHPTAAKPPKYPDYPAYYVGDTRVFGIEQQFTSAYDAMLKKLKGDIASVVFDKKNKASALFFEMEGGGPGEIVLDALGETFIVVKIKTANSNNHVNLLHELETTSPANLQPEGKIKLSGNVVIFDSAHSASDLAKHNWGTSNLTEGFEQASKLSSQGPIKLPNQQSPGGAFLCIVPGTYYFSIDRNNKTRDLTYNALWFWKA